MQALATTRAPQSENRIVIYGSVGRPRERVDRVLLGQSVILGVDFNTHHASADHARLSLMLGDLSDRDFEIVLSKNFQQLREKRKLQQAKAPALKDFYCDQRNIRASCNPVVKMIKAKGRPFSREDALTIGRYWSWIASSHNREALVSETNKKLQQLCFTIPKIVGNVFNQLQEQFTGMISPPKKEKIKTLIQEFQERVTKCFAVEMQQLLAEQSIANDYLRLQLDIMSESFIKLAVCRVMQEQIDSYDRWADALEKVELEFLPKHIETSRHAVKINEELLALDLSAFEEGQQFAITDMENNKKKIDEYETRLKELRERREPVRRYADVLPELNAFDQLLLDTNSSAHDLYERIDAFSQLIIR